MYIMVLLSLIKSITPNNTELKYSIIDYIFFFITIAYVWSIPKLSQLSFYEGDSKKQFGNYKGAWSISQYIASPPATGAMAFCYFNTNIKMILLNEKLIKNIRSSNLATILLFFRFIYILFFNIFLIVTFTYVPKIHSIVVGIFMIAFILHSISFIILMRKYKYNKDLDHNLIIGEIILAVGIFSAIMIGLSLLGILKNVVKTQRFWLLECIGLTAMPIFTLIATLILNSTDSNN